MAIYSFSQSLYTYTSKESLFINWIKRDGAQAYPWTNDAHYVGALLDTYWYEIRNFVCWKWSYNDIPIEANVKSVTLKFRVRKYNFNHNFQFYLHNIPYPLDSKNINFFDECNNNSKIYLSDILTPDTNHNIMFSKTFTEQSPHGKGFEIWNAVNNAVKSGKYFLTLGIRENTPRLLPFWTISGYDLITTTYEPCIDLIITYEVPNKFITIDQKLSNGISIGSIGIWDTSQGSFIEYNVPKIFSWEVNSIKIIRSSQASFNNEKFNFWKFNNQIDTNVINTKKFKFYSFIDNLISNFNPSYENILLKNNFIEKVELNPDYDYIYFKDPWLIDYPDPQYGNTLRNRGMDAPFKQRPSPFTPDYTTN
jgi:hypothetical protein